MSAADATAPTADADSDAARGVTNQVRTSSGVALRRKTLQISGFRRNGRCASLQVVDCWLLGLHTERLSGSTVLLQLRGLS
jgi:hypothetical protein